MELDQNAEDMIKELMGILLSGHINDERWEDGISGYIHFLEQNNINYKRLSEPTKYLYLKEAINRLSQELGYLHEHYEYWADYMIDDEENGDEESEDDVNQEIDRMVEVDIDIFSEQE